MNALTSAVRLDWSKVGQALGMENEFSELIKQYGEPEDGKWHIYMPKGLTCNKIISVLEDMPWSDLWEYLDKYVTENDRDPNKDGFYAISVKATVVDEENASPSADQLKEQGHQGITLMERLLLGFAYFLTTGQQLEIKTWTLCAGSRYQDGDVPSVNRSDNIHKVSYSLWDPLGRYRNLCSRSVEILKPKSA